MTSLPTRLGLNSSTLTQGQFKVAIGDLRDYLNEALGSSGTAPTLTGAAITNASSLGVGTFTPGAEVQITGGLTITDVATPDVNPGWGHAYIKYGLRFSGDDGTKIRLKGTTQTIGTQDTSIYARTGSSFNIYVNGVHSNTVGQAGTGGEKLLSVDSTSLLYKSYTVWHSGNDGSGSGLDADTLDGYNLVVDNATASTVVGRNSAGNIIANQITLSNYPTDSGHAVTKGYLESLSVTSTSPYSLTGGGKLIVMGGTDSQASPRGIYLWANDTSDWGIYAASAGANKSLAGGTATGSISTRNGRAFRSRIYAGVNDYFLWENSNETTLMELTANSGDLLVRGNIYAGNSFLNVVWNSGNDGENSGLDADKLHGKFPAIAATGNTIVVRDASGSSQLNQLYLTTAATDGGHAVRKEYVDAKPTKTYVRCATVGNLAVTSSGSQTLINNANGVLIVDNITISNDGGTTRVLVKDQTDATQNGIYYCSDSGSGGSPWKLTRTPDADGWKDIVGMQVYVANGGTNNRTLWLANVDDSGTVSSDNITFVKLYP